MLTCMPTGRLPEMEIKRQIVGRLSKVICGVTRCTVNAGSFIAGLLCEVGVYWRSIQPYVIGSFTVWRAKTMTEALIRVGRCAGWCLVYVLLLCCAAIARIAGSCWCWWSDRRAVSLVRWAAGRCVLSVQQRPESNFTDAGHATSRM